MPRYQFSKVAIAQSIIDRKDWVKYLILMNWHIKDLENIVSRVPDEAFGAFVEKHLHGYLEGTAPPPAIQTAIMNIADDYASGREITLKAGDYIALQTAFQHQQGPHKSTKA